MQFIQKLVADNNVNCEENLNYMHHNYIIDHVRYAEPPEIDDFFIEFPYCTTTNVPVFPPSEHFKSDIDFITDSVEDKREWDKKMSMNAKICKKKKYFQHFPKYPQVCKLYDLCEEELMFLRYAEKDPDRSFNSVNVDYNWKYTGGTLSHVIINNELYLISVQGESSDELWIKPIDKTNKFDFEDKLNIGRYKASEEHIYQTKAESINGIGFIGARARKTCNLYKLRRKGEQIELDHCKYVSTDNDDFVSVDISLNDIGKFCTLTNSRKFSVWDINAQTRSAVVEGKIPIIKHAFDNFCSATFARFYPSSVAFIDRYIFMLFDLRMSLEKPSSSIDLSKKLWHCDYLSQLISSESGFYISSLHNLMTIDVKALKILQTMPHFMQAAPCYGSVVTQNERNVVCLGNQIRNEVGIYIKDWKDEIPVSCFSPLMLPSLNSTLRSLQEAGKFLDLRISKRFLKSISGLTSISFPESNEISFYIQTSGGDVFMHNLVSKSSNIQERKGNFDAWEKEAENNLINHPVNTLKLINAKNTFTLMQNENTKFLQKSISNSSHLLTKDFKILITKKEMLKHVDYYAKQISSSWGLNEIFDSSNVRDEREINLKHSKKRKYNSSSLNIQADEFSIEHNITQSSATKSMNEDCSGLFESLTSKEKFSYKRSRRSEITGF